ncbi:coiled-coil domain-containing protein 115 [Brachionichthys hirsutus]|uniref:coiled-coil domain-containing protein 115 n=1 Tax=Brachionichthys hirsutus TaxID=412623 RepID=UPI0036053639
MPAAELETSSLILDENLLRFLDQLELLDEKRAALNSLVEQGWFSMSQARYSMGNKHVSALQYASETEPLVCVHARTLDNGEVSFCTERVEQKYSSEDGKGAGSVEDIGPQEASGVRRRMKSKNELSQTETSEESSSRKASEVAPVKGCDRCPYQDPLKWFGILVPQSLKQAQSSFKQVIELSAEIAALQTAVLSTRRELKLGMKDKHNLQQNASAEQLS